MSLTVQAISSHPALVLDVEEVLADLKEYPYLPSVRNAREATSRSKFPRLFLLDTCSLHKDVGPLTERCRASSPGSKFISLLSPADSNDADKIWLLHHGIDGFVELSETWKTELPQAIRSVLGGQYWVPSQVLAAFRKHTQVLEQARVLGKSLTGREGQILRLLMQHLTNKEISRQLAITERTVKFHISHLLAKFGCEDRHGLRDLWKHVHQENVFQLDRAHIKNRKTLKRVSAGT
jgi:DNA-binding NarL/FixJ family response regulator